jgi:hypothetical protein
MVKIIRSRIDISSFSGLPDDIFFFNPSKDYDPFCLDIVESHSGTSTPSSSFHDRSSSFWQSRLQYIAVLHFI